VFTFAQNRRCVRGKRRPIQLEPMLNDRFGRAVAEAKRYRRDPEVLLLIRECGRKRFGDVRFQKLTSMIRDILRGTRFHGRLYLRNLLMDVDAALQLGPMVMKHLSAGEFGVLLAKGFRTRCAGARQSSGFLRDRGKRRNLRAQVNLGICRQSLRCIAVSEYRGPPLQERRSVRHAIIVQIFGPGCQIIARLLR